MHERKTEKKKERKKERKNEWTNERIRELRNTSNIDETNTKQMDDVGGGIYLIADISRLIPVPWFWVETFKCVIVWSQVTSNMKSEGGWLFICLYLTDRFDISSSVSWPVWISVIYDTLSNKYHIFIVNGCSHIHSHSLF